MVEGGTQQGRPKRRLINGRLMCCPRCKKDHDILQYIPMRLVEEFARETTVIYKCPDCRWIFAPIDDIVLEVLRQRGDSAEDIEVAQA